MARTKSTKPAFVRIQSTKTINVTMGLQCQNVTNKDAHIPDRLKVNPLWPKLSVLILEGVHWYPSEITEWNTVKSLVNDKVITIGEYSDSCDEETVQTEKEELNKNIEEVNKRLNEESVNVAPSLEDISEE